MSYNKPYVWGIASVAALGGLLFGYDWVVIGGAKPFYEAYFDLTSPQLIGWANSCALVGCLLGSVVCSALSDRLGRRKLLVVAAFLFAISSTCTGLASIIRLRVPETKGKTLEQIEQELIARGDPTPRRQPGSPI